jgi:hypothetical protein
MSPAAETPLAGREPLSSRHAGTPIRLPLFGGAYSFRAFLALCGSPLLVTLGVDKFGVFDGKAIRGALPIQFGILHRHVFAAMGSLSVLLPPFQRLEFGASQWLTTLIVAEFLNDFAAVSEL